MISDKQITELIKYGKIAGEKGYTPGISGNLSCRDNDNIIITASGTASGFLEKDDFSVITKDNKIIAGNQKPSTERLLHLAFYQKRKDINCIFHCHSPFLTALASSIANFDEMISPEIIYCFGKIPLAKYAIPGSLQLVNNTAEYFEQNDIVLMENHGVIIGADSVKNAYLKLEILEEYAKTLAFAKLLGGAKILSDKDVKEIELLKRGH